MILIDKVYWFNTIEHIVKFADFEAFIKTIEM